VSALDDFVVGLDAKLSDLERRVDAVKEAKKKK
jgi:hypothetical protein